MKIFRLILLALATALCVINFWTINYHDLWVKESLWAYFRIIMALFLILLLVKTVRSANKSVHKKSRINKNKSV